MCLLFPRVALLVDLHLRLLDLYISQGHVSHRPPPAARDLPTTVNWNSSSSSSNLPPLPYCPCHACSLVLILFPLVLVLVLGRLLVVLVLALVVARFLVLILLLHPLLLRPPSFLFLPLLPTFLFPLPPLNLLLFVIFFLLLSSSLAALPAASD